MTQRDHRLSRWTDVVDQDPPSGDLYRSGIWLLARYPRLYRLAARIPGVVEIEDDGPSFDLDRLVEVVSAEPRYSAAWDEYASKRRPPTDEARWERWRAAGPQPDDFTVGLSDFLVMSSGEVASLRLLATFGSGRTPFSVSDLRSLDAEGQRLLADWCRAMDAANSHKLNRPERPSVSVPVDSISYWPVDPPERGS